MLGHSIMSDIFIILFKNDHYLRQSFALILERAGYKTISTDSAKKALESIKSAKYQLVISDTDILDTRSILLPIIRDMPGSIQAIILTDHTISDLIRGDQFSNIHYLEKPVAPERLLSFVGEVISQED
jgi:DNA-binding NtrC family response regulator